jgi:uncharacterized peroxidase-related enzyme
MTRPAPRIAPLDLAHADAATAATLGAVKAKLGMVPNMFRTFARSPATLNGYLSLSDALGGGALSAAQREIVALAVGQANTCGYCLAAHSVIGKGAGLDQAAIQAARRGAGVNPRDAALAKFARQLTETRGVVSDADVAAFKQAGFDDGVVIEVIGLVALNTLTNYVNHLAGTQIDFPAVPVELAA